MSNAPGDEDRPTERRPGKESERLGTYRRPTMDFEREATVGGGAMAWAAVGIEFGLYVVLFFLGGKWLDGKFGWDPWGAAMGGLLGALMGMFALIRRVMRTSDDDAGAGGPDRGASGD